MTAIKRYSRQVMKALFTLTLGDVFDWGTSVPIGESPRSVAPASDPTARARSLDPHWDERDRYHPTPG